MEVVDNSLKSENFDENCDTMEQQSDEKSQNLLMGYDEADFEAHFNGNGTCSGEEYDENDDETFSNRCLTDINITKFFKKSIKLFS